MTRIASASPPDRFAQTKTARLARARLARTLEGLEDDVKLWRTVQARVPAAWATLEEDIDCAEPKVKITLRLDASVAKVFRAMGKGYQERMNRVLATYVQMKIGEVAREREFEEEVNEFLRERLPDDMGEFYWKHRHLLEGGGGDIERMDSLFGGKK